MSAEEPLDRIVLRYLQKRGYKDAEKAFLKESKSQKLTEMALVPHPHGSRKRSDVYRTSPSPLVKSLRHNWMGPTVLWLVKQIFPYLGNRLPRLVAVVRSGH